MIDSLARYAGGALLLSLEQLFLILGPGLALGLLLHLLSSYTRVRACALFGNRLWMLLFGLPGTVVHEAGHAVFCPVFGHKIKRIKWFDLKARDGRLGYVEHSYQPGNIWHQTGNFFIGIGPILLGSLVIYIAAWLLLLPEVARSLHDYARFEGVPLAPGEWGHLAQTVGGSVLETLRLAFSPASLGRWQTWLFFYLAFAVGSSITLSPPDIQVAGHGFVALVLLLLIFNFATFWLGDSTAPAINFAVQCAVVFNAILLFAVIFNVMGAMLAGGMYGLARRFS